MKARFTLVAALWLLQLILIETYSTLMKIDEQRKFVEFYKADTAARGKIALLKPGSKERAAAQQKERLLSDSYLITRVPSGAVRDPWALYAVLSSGVFVLLTYWAAKGKPRAELSQASTA